MLKASRGLLGKITHEASEGIGRPFRPTTCFDTSGTGRIV